MADERWEATLDRILELTVLLSQDAAGSLAREGLTQSRAHVMWQLAQRGPSTQATLAGDLHVTPRTITALVDALVDTGFVTREPHPSDRRATLVTFTERGHATARALVEGHRRLASELFAGLPDGVFGGFDTGLRHVLTQFRGVLAAKNPGALMPAARPEAGQPEARRAGQARAGQARAGQARAGQAGLTAGSHRTG